MEPDQRLIDEIYREKVMRARSMSPARRAEIGAELSDVSGRMMREAIRRQFPQVSEAQIHELMRERIELARRLDDVALPESEDAA